VDKLSSILPSNQRITTVDTMAARPVRSGVEGYGAPIALHERRPSLAASDMLNISKTGKELADLGSMTEHISDSPNEQSLMRAGSTATQQSAEHASDHSSARSSDHITAQAEIDSRDQLRASTREASHAFEPEEKMHIADDLTNIQALRASPRGGATSLGMIAQAGNADGMMPRAVERLQSGNPSKPASRLSVTA
jgi:hypothetical protein